MPVEVVRPTLRSLIAAVRAALGDDLTCVPSVATQLLIQRALDAHRTDYTRLVLTEQVGVNPTTRAFEWRTYFAGGEAGATLGNWEEDALLQSNVYADLTTDPGTTINYNTGEVTFAATVYPPVYWTGKSFDVYAAAADMALLRAAGVVTAFDWSADGQSMSEGQKFTNWAALAKLYRQQAQVVTGAYARSDGGR